MRLTILEGAGMGSSPNPTDMLSGILVSVFAVLAMIAREIDRPSLPEIHQHERKEDGVGPDGKLVMIFGCSVSQECADRTVKRYGLGR